MNKTWYYEDCIPGASYQSGPVEVSEEGIIAFARQFDPQPFHTDPEAAHETFFRGLAASGWHTAALTMRMVVESENQLAGGVIGMGVEELRWPRPVRPGDVLTLKCEVLEARLSNSMPDRGIVKMQNTTFNQRQETVQIMKVNLIVLRRNQ